MPHSPPALKTRTLLKHGHAVKTPIWNRLNTGLYIWRCYPGLAALTAVAAFPAYVKGACRAIAFLRNFCQVSCLQGQKEQMRWDKPEKRERWGDIRPRKSLWGMQHLGAIRAKQVSLIVLQKTLYLVMHNKYLLHREQWKPRKNSRSSLQSGVQKISAV